MSEGSAKQSLPFSPSHKLISDVNQLATKLGDKDRASKMAGSNNIPFISKKHANILALVIGIFLISVNARY